MSAKKMKRVGVKVDMTPMVDVAFLLLIFFMSTSQFDPPQKVPILLPDSHSNLKVPESDVLILGISKDSRLFWQVGKNPQEETDLPISRPSCSSSGGRIRGCASPSRPTRSPSTA